MPSWVLFPRLHLAEVEDQSWCPSWLREHTHRALSRMWQASNSSNGSPAAQACDLLLKVLGGPGRASQFTIVDACAGAGGPTPVLAPTLNAKLTNSGHQPVEFVLTDLWPDIRAWEKIVKRSEHISYIEEPIDATKPRRLAKPGTKECRIFNLCFHHFDDPAAKKVLASAVKSADAFMIIEMTHRTLPSLLNTTFVILSVFFTTLYDFYWSPKHLLFTYLIPIVPLFYAIDGYVSCTRGRTPDETWALLKCQPDLDLSQWELKSGEQTALLPFGRMYWYSGVKKTTKSNGNDVPLRHRLPETHLREKGAEEETKENDKGKEYVFLDELARQARDPVELRSQLLNILLAGRDTTASFLGWTFYLLARHQTIFYKLRQIVLRDFGTFDQPTEITFARLHACQYLQWVNRETLRLFPVVPVNARRALKDTSLPVGGGADGLSKIFIRKGQVINYSVHVMHRHRDLWGPNADEFVPERWDKRQSGWDYLPFNGGARICLGQKFALTNASYVIVRLLQQFEAIENVDSEAETKHHLTLTDCSGTGVQIRLQTAIS